MKKIISIVATTIFLASLINFTKPAEAQEEIITPIEIEETVVIVAEVIEEPEEVEITIEDEINQHIAELDTFKEDKQTYLIKYYEVINEYSEYYGTPVVVSDIYTAEEIDLMCRCIMTEIGGGSFDAKVNVAQVILNRINSEKFPNDPTSVITAANQFAYGSKGYDTSILQALEYAYLFGSEEVKDALFFQSMGYMEEWNGRELKWFDSYHYFY